MHAAFTLWLPDGPVGAWCSDLIGIPPFLLAGLACLQAAAEPREEGRAAWRAFGLGLLAFGVGDIVWTYLDLVRRVQPFPSVADVLYLSMPMAFVAGFLTVLRPAASRPWSLRSLLDMAVVLGAAALISWRFIVSEMLEVDGYKGHLVAHVVALAYPVLDLALLGLALLLTVQGSALHRQRSGLVALGLVCVAIADSAFAYLSAHDTYGSGAITDQFWSVGAALIGFAALRRVPPEPASVPAANPRWWAAAPYVSVGAVTVLEFTTYGVRGPAALGVLAGGGVLTLLIVARQALSVQENQRLSEALRDLSDGLEARVAERTEALRQQGAALDRANAELRTLSQGLELKVIERTAALEASRAQLAYQAQHDALTSLPNRTVFEDRLTQAAHAANRYGGEMAVMFIDLDGFKFVNDTFGHVAGDEVLLEVGRRLLDCVRSADTVARLGGDEFVVLLTRVGHVADVRTVAQRIVSRLALPVSLGEQDVRITASVGVALFPDDAHTPQQLLVNADVAMYEAKQRGKNTVQFYAPSMNLAAQRRSVVERRLRGALDCGAFTLHYQPQHDAAGDVCAFEALLRWTDPELGAVSPAEFIPVAEDAGLIVPIGAWVLNEACRQWAQWHREGLPSVRMAVNVSPTQFAREDFVASVVDILSRHGMAAWQLELELTEQLVVQDIQTTAAKMQALRDRGVRIAVDDFGSGHSALSYLMRLPVSTLKIDRAFIRDLGHVDGASRVVGAITALAHALELDVVAEGVETAEQLREVRGLGCEFTQGYLLGRPGPADQARATLLRIDGRPAVPGAPDRQ